MIKPEDSAVISSTEPSSPSYPEPRKQNVCKQLAQSTDNILEEKKGSLQ